MKTKAYQNISAFLFLLSVLYLPIFSFAQTGHTNVRGIVRNDSGYALPSVSVIVKNEKTNFTAATQTDSVGVFKFVGLPSGSNYSFTFSYVGFKSQTVTGSNLKPGTDFSLLIKLEEQHQALNDIVVIGYGTAKKSDLTGSIAVVAEKDFNKGVATNSDQLIQGKAAGVTILQSNAQPGGATRIQIRGITSLNASNQPLYVIDGMPIDNSVLNAPTSDLTKAPALAPPPPNPLNTINPSDIASIQILKDASATAIYGSRGANGVVLITTKKGSAGRVSVSYNGSVGFQKIAKEYDLPNAYEYASGFNKYYDFYKSINATDPIFNNSVVKKFTDSQLDSFKVYGGTDWFNALTRNGFINNQQLSVSGGSKTSTYYASVGYLDQKGVVSLSDIKRISARFNFTQKLGDFVEFGLNLGVSNAKTNNVPTGTNDVGDSRGGATSGAMWWSPTTPGYTAAGTINVHPFNIQNQNPYGLKLMDNNSEDNRTMVTSYLQAHILKNLTAKVTAGYDKAIDNSRTFVPAEAKNTLAANGEATQGNYTNSTNLLNFILQYKTTIKKHTIDITGGTDYQTFKYESFYGKASGFSTSAFSYNNMSAATSQYTYSGKTTSSIFSYLGRVNYSYDDRFLLTGSFRYDGSSKFAEGHKWGFFPSGAFAWKIINEKFMHDNGAFSDLKLRLSYGKTGNQAIGTNNSQPFLGSTQVGTIGEQKVFPIGPTSPGNKDLTWETTTQQDVGLDFGFLKNRITASVDYYKQVTTNLLLSFQTPATSGFTSVVRNAGAIQNNGVELSINSQNLVGKLGWSTSFNISYNKNRWKDRAGLPYAPAQEFGPVYGIYGYVVDGIWQVGDNIAGSSQPLSHPGQFRFKDIQGYSDSTKKLTSGPDGVLNSYDRVLLGSTFPTTTLGFTNTFTYKNVTLSFFFQGLFGFKIYNAARAQFENPYNLLQFYGVSRDGLNFWTPSNTKTNIPSGLANSYGSSVNSEYVESGNFVRLKNVNIGYQIPFHSPFIKSANVYLNFDNVWLITKYKGLDPETANPVNGKSGSENDVYPNSRTYSLGVNFNF